MEEENNKLNEEIIKIKQEINILKEGKEPAEIVDEEKNKLNEEISKLKEEITKLNEELKNKEKPKEEGKSKEIIEEKVEIVGKK